jgi:hypothetical protein
MPPPDAGRVRRVVGLHGTSARASMAIERKRRRTFVADGGDFFERSDELRRV